MNRKATERVHALEIPINGLSLLVPTAGTAEVVNVPELTPIPFSQEWLVGAIGWRMQAIPVVSFESLMGGAAHSPAPGSKIVIFYPLTGRREWEFFGILSSAEPRPHAVDNSALTANPADLPDTPYIAAGLKLEGRLMAIPNMDALKAVFYPS